MDFWDACWISAALEEDSPIFTKTFTVPDEIIAADCLISGLGYSYFYINGKPVSDAVCSPPWSDYHKRNLDTLIYPINDTFSYSIYYNKYDIKPLLKTGENVIEVHLGSGFYNQTARSVEGVMNYGAPKLLLSCLIVTESGTLKLESDESFQYFKSPVVYNQVFRGEVYDVRIKKSDQMLLDPIVVCGAYELPGNPVLRENHAPVDRIVRRLKPTLIAGLGDAKIYDVGENISGTAAFTTNAPEGERVTLRFAEELTADGRLDFASCGGDGQIQTDTYISDGKENQRYSPLFVWHGFRYFEVSGDCSDLTVNVIHTDLEKTGDFQCDNDTLNFIVDAYKRSQLTNIHGAVPSDCPHRERLGYTGDGQITCDSASFFFDTRAFYQKWIRDIADCQCKVSGHVQHTAPFCGGGGGPGGWGGAMVVVPYFYYLHYGDAELLREYFENMCRYMDYLGTRSEGHIVMSEEPGGWCLGDWAFPDENEITLPEPLVNTYYYCKCADMLSEISSVLKNTAAQKKYKTLADNIRRAFREKFISADGKFYGDGKQAASTFALDMGLLDETVFDTLVKYYEDRGGLDTGIFGTPILTDLLFKREQGDLAVKLLTTPDQLSFENMRRHGATTLWEYFRDAWSHNHPMFGSVTASLFRHVLGIKLSLENAGFSRIVLSPKFISSLSFAKGHITLPKGRLTVQWHRDGATVTYTAQAPEAISGEIIIGGRIWELRPGENKIEITE